MLSSRKTSLKSNSRLSLLNCLTFLYLSSLMQNECAVFNSVSACIPIKNVSPKHKPGEIPISAFKQGNCRHISKENTHFTTTVKKFAISNARVHHVYDKSLKKKKVRAGYEYIVIDGLNLYHRAYFLNEALGIALIIQVHMAPKYKNCPQYIL